MLTTVVLVLLALALLPAAIMVLAALGPYLLAGTLVLLIIIGVGVQMKPPPAPPAATTSGIDCELYRGYWNPKTRGFHALVDDKVIEVEADTDPVMRQLRDEFEAKCLTARERGDTP